MFRVTTSGRCAHEFLGTGLPCVVHDEHAHHEVLIEKIRWAGLVRPDASDQSGQMKHDVGGMFRE